MIVSFRDAEAELLHAGQRSKRLPADIQETARRKLRYLNEAGGLEDLLVPSGNRLEKLSGNREGQFRIRINDQWRICFNWTSVGAEKVEIVDYHRG